MNTASLRVVFIRYRYVCFWNPSHPGQDVSIPESDLQGYHMGVMAELHQQKAATMKKRVFVLVPTQIKGMYVISSSFFTSSLLIISFPFPSRGIRDVWSLMDNHGLKDSTDQWKGTDHYFQNERCPAVAFSYTQWEKLLGQAKSYWLGYLWPSQCWSEALLLGLANPFSSRWHS